MSRALLLLAVGCTSPSGPAPVGPMSPVPVDGDSGDTGVPPPPPGRGLVLEGQLQVVSGTLVDGELRVTVRDPDRQTSVCHALLTGLQGVPVQPDPPGTVFAMWTVHLPTSTCLQRPSLVLGIGPLLPALYPDADVRGVSIEHTRGFYTGPPQTEDVLIFGLAGTEEQRAGHGVTPHAEPLPDGLYRVEGVYLLPL